MSLQVWSDCSGINSEMFALRELSQSLKQVISLDVTWCLHFACDSDARSIAFAEANHFPKHVGTNMQQRNLTSGTYWCTACSQDHDLPKGTMDLYVGTYPCSPWSRRGTRTGFDHPMADAFHIGVQTINYMQPAVFIIELGELPEKTAVEQVCKEILKRLQVSGAAPYTLQPLRNMTPAWSGYPIKRSRFFLLGWRSDIGAGNGLTEPLTTLLQNPLEVAGSYRSFLGLKRTIDWSRVGEFCDAQESAFVLASGCTCSANPWTRCPLHPCKCRRCGDDGMSCRWRRLLSDFVEKEKLTTQVADAGRLTYIQVLELNQGVAPDQPRARVILNVMALLPQTQPLNDSLLLADTAQNPPFMTLARDGFVQTLTTNSAVWCLWAGRYLKTWELAALMGFKTREMHFGCQSEHWFRTRLGLAVHVGNFGLALLALMAKPLSMCSRT